MSTGDPLFLQQSWQHLMGPLETLLDDAWSNTAMIRDSHGAIDALLSRAERQRSAAEAALRELAARRQELTETLDEIQRELAVAGVLLRGEIS